MVWQVGETRATLYSPAMRYGYGFTITGAHGAPVVTMVYDTKEKSEQAEALVRQAVGNAVSISTP